MSNGEGKWARRVKTVLRIHFGTVNGFRFVYYTEKKMLMIF